jgi:hypothetical protein
VLSLAGGASASVAPTQNTARIILAEEEVSDVSLATFYVFVTLAGVAVAGLALYFFSMPETQERESVESKADRYRPALAAK